MAEFVGRIVLTLNGVVLAQGKSFSEDTDTGAKSLRGFSPTGLPVGIVTGTPEFTIELELYIPKVSIVTVDWPNLTDAVLTASPLGGVGPTIIFSGCFVKKHSISANETDEATRKLTLGALARRELTL